MLLAPADGKTTREGLRSIAELEMKKCGVEPDSAAAEPVNDVDVYKRQGIARIFGQNLKDEYDGEERDRVLEQLILLYAADLL